MTGLVPLQPRTPAEAPHDAIDSWIPVLADVGTLAKAIADTDFVPQAFRGKPAAVAAAVLTGRELRIGPMTALAHLHVVKGHVGMSAQLMRQLILTAGHELRYVETTDTRCVVEGRRRGTEEWTCTTFTADQARKAGVQNMQHYPEDMLVARATSRLARRLFADCLGGVPYLADELEDGTGAAGPTGVEAPAAPAGRTVQRRQKPAPLQPPAPPLEQAQEAPQPPEQPTPDQPPLDEPEPPHTRRQTPPQATSGQLTAIAAAMGQLGYRDRPDRLRLTSSLTGRDITSGKDLTKTEAGALLDTLTMAQASPDPQARIIEITETAGSADESRLRP